MSKTSLIIARPTVCHHVYIYAPSLLIVGQILKCYFCFSSYAKALLGQPSETAAATATPAASSSSLDASACASSEDSPASPTAVSPPPTPATPSRSPSLSQSSCGSAISADSGLPATPPPPSSQDEQGQQEPPVWPTGGQVSTAAKLF